MTYGLSRMTAYQQLNIADKTPGFQRREPVYVGKRQIMASRYSGREQTIKGWGRGPLFCVSSISAYIPEACLGLWGGDLGQFLHPGTM